MLGSSTRTSTAFIFRGGVPLAAAVLLRSTLCVSSLIVLVWVSDERNEDGEWVVGERRGGKRERGGA